MAAGNDLETIVALLELAAISLTSRPEDTFTYDQLLVEARRWGEPDIVLDERDVHIVFPFMKIFKKQGKLLSFK